LPIGAIGDCAAALMLIDHIDALCLDLNVPTKLAQVGVRSNQLDDLVHGSRGNSMNGNPRQLSDAELRKILEACL
jgi:alcohol dehydrogenase class IV